MRSLIVAYYIEDMIYVDLKRSVLSTPLIIKIISIIIFRNMGLNIAI
jgi:hypothetical protein